MDLSIVIVAWKVKDLLKKNLNAIFANTQNISFEIFLIDNNSGDGTAEMIKQDFAQVKLIANQENLGFAKANNQAIERSSGRYVLLLNPDMMVAQGTLEKMVAWMDDNQEAAVAGCKLLDGNGKIINQVRRFPAFFDQLMVVLKIPHVFPFVLNRYLNIGFDYDKEAQVDSIRGSFFMIRRQTIEKIGMLDERYFIWFEEVDYCRQVKQAGLKVVYTPVAECVDYIGKSFLQVNLGVTQGYFRDSMLKYFKKWHPGWRYVLLRATWPVGILLTKIFR